MLLRPGRTLTTPSGTYQVREQEEKTSLLRDALLQRLEEHGFEAIALDKNSSPQSHRKPSGWAQLRPRPVRPLDRLDHKQLSRSIELTEKARHLLAQASEQSDPAEAAYLLGRAVDCLKQAAELAQIVERWIEEPAKGADEE